MKQLHILVSDEFHQELKKRAAEEKTTMAEIIMNKLEVKEELGKDKLDLDELNNVIAKLEKPQKIKPKKKKKTFKLCQKHNVYKLSCGCE